ncbi:MAG TPA: hypothetical protein VN408_29295, partial [Actinoplanes sp.]|nr:hypothetical protein [Actinoplanes sp.]
LLARAGDPAALAVAVRAALDLADLPMPSRVGRARARISDGLTVDSMAGSLAGIYTSVAVEEHPS